MDSELSCKACTFINEIGTKICNACGKTLNASSVDFNTDGIVCGQCTYVNPVSSINCRLCEFILERDVKVTAVASSSTSVTQECRICLSPVVSEMFMMPFCHHVFCVICAKKHFTTKITNYGIHTFRCPIDVCNYFDRLTNHSKFFNDLESSLKHVLHEDAYKTYQKKIATSNIIGLPGFIRCPLCNHGFLHSNSMKAYCRECKDYFCSKCMMKWKAGHSIKMCNDGSGDISGATNASCPNCQYKYFLERGGCMHITCTQCSYDYCEFCLTKFTIKGKSCGFENCNKQQSLHGHHPRNCMYYLREMDHSKIEKLLQTRAIQYGTNQSRKSSKCEIKVSVDTDGIWRDSECNKPATMAYNNMCLHHYKWHLGELMKQHGVDVVDVMNSLECSCELNRNNIRIPNAQSEYKACEDAYTPELKKLIRSRIPYKKMSQ